jgi:hypothetical protein
MSQPQIFNIKMIAPGIELVLEALAELPMKRSQPLYNEIAGQYAYQLQQNQQSAQAADTQAVEASNEPTPEESQS